MVSQDRILGTQKRGLGNVPASQVGAELLFDVISTAYEHSSVIVTTNLPCRNDHSSIRWWTLGRAQVILEEKSELLRSRRHGSTREFDQDGRERTPVPSRPSLS